MFMPMQYDIPRTYQAQSLIRVTGIEAAKSYQMPANSVVTLFDNNDDVFYLKTTDGAGFPTIRTFKFEEITNTPSPISSDYISKSDLDDLRKEFKDYVKQYFSESGSKPGYNKPKRSEDRDGQTASI